MIDWCLVSENPPLDSGLGCLVCTKQGNLAIAEYHSDPDGWFDVNENQKYDVVAYILLCEIPLPMRETITNDN